MGTMTIAERLDRFAVTLPRFWRLARPRGDAP